MPDVSPSGLTDAIRVKQIELAVTTYRKAVEQDAGDTQWQRYMLLKRVGYFINTL